MISSILQMLLGAALLGLWHIDPDPRHRYARLWGWSAVLLGLGLMVGLALVPEGETTFVRRDLQGALASALLMLSLYLQMNGTRQFLQLRWHPGRWGLLLLAAMLCMAVAAHWSLPAAVLLGALVLALGNLACALWMAGAPGLTERLVAAGFVAMALVNLSGPLLHPLSRSPITHGAGLLTQCAISVGLILLAVGRAHREARRQAERFTRLAEHSLQGLAVLRHGELLYANPAALAMYGYRDLDHARQNDLHRVAVPADLLDEARQRHARVLADPGARIEWDAPRLTLDGRQLYVHCLSSHLLWDDAPAELLVILDDTARQQALLQLRRQALQDELTGLPNRNFVVEQLQRLSTRTDPAVLVSADVDRFQLINETLGHELGDELLRALGQRLLQRLPPQAVLARLGEDQFLVLQEPGDSAAAQALVEQLLHLLEEPFEVGGHALYVHMSLGVALYPQDARDAAGVLRAADSAMHRAKGLPGSAYVFFEQGMFRSARARMQAEQAMARAIQEREFLLEYQPKWSAGARTLSGFEALVRWQRGDGTRVSPVDFIPAAERTGQIRALGELIVQMALEQLQAWRAAGLTLVPVAVNVSPLQFEDPDFAGALLLALRVAGLPTEVLELEITETAAIGHMDQVLPQLETLRTRGVRCALDDFGTGHSSLSMLRRLPIACMKLDRSMIDPLPDAEAAAIVRASCALGQSLGLEIVAEGVETEAQAQAAEQLGCTHLQGYHLGRPMAAEAAARLLRDAA